MVRRGEKKEEGNFMRVSAWRFLDDPCRKKRAISQANIQNRGDQAVCDEGFVFLWILLEYFNVLEVSYVCQASSALTISLLFKIDSNNLMKTTHV